MKNEKISIETHGDQSPGYVAGNFTVNQTIVHQYKESKKKQWRELDEITYPAIIDDQERRMKYGVQLAFHLHRTFKETGYIRFVSLFSLKKVEVKDDIHPIYDLFSHQVRFIGSLRETWKYLWESSLPEDPRRKYQEDLNKELMNLYETWSLDLRMPFVERLAPWLFIYDPDGKKISITVPPFISTNPSEYPDKLRTTSEMLTLLTAIIRSPIVDFGNLSCIRSHYPLFKLFLELLDNKSWEPAKIRINAADYEEWDYINLAADNEVGRYSQTNNKA